jgi:hypothetical protein
MKIRHALLITLTATLAVPSLVACGSEPAATPRRSTGTGATGGSSGGDTSSGGTSGGTTSGDAGIERGVGPGDAGAPTPVGDPSTTPPTDTGACNYIDNTATPVTSTTKLTQMPAPAGGEQPLDGSYLLTAAVHYGTGGSGTTYKNTVYLSSGTHQYVTSKNNGTEVRTTMRVVYDSTTGTLTLNGRCGSTATQTLAYTTVSPTQIIIYDAANNDAFTYTRPEPADVPSP